jgi:hypothetical protein
LTRSLSLAKQSPPDLAMVAIGIAGGLIAFAIHGMVDYEEIGRIPILWFYFGLISAMTKITADLKHEATKTLICKIGLD